MLNVKDMPENTMKIKPLHASQIKNKADIITLDEFSKAMEFAWKMISACQQWGGIGLAATQLGARKSIIVLRDLNTEDTFRVCLNPSYKPIKDKGTTKLEEGCLSVPGKIVRVARWQEIDASWIEKINGEFVTQSVVLSGLEARVFQHEVDHLFCISILDK